jgi:hypothetical protein
MKAVIKHINRLIVSMVLLGLVSACDFFFVPSDRSESYATLLLVSNAEDRSALPQELIDTLRYDFEFKGPGNELIHYSAEPGTKVIRRSLFTGKWTISAKAYTADTDILAGTGQTNVKIKAGDNTVIIPMSATNTMSAKEITSFSITAPEAASGIINEAEKTISVGVPSGAAVSAMTVLIAHNGVSVNPDSDTTLDFSSPRIFTVTALDGSTQAYTVSVHVAASSEKEIISFGITVPVAASGVINTGENTISVSVPALTPVSAMTVVIGITGVSVSPASGSTLNFTGPQTFTVTAADGTTRQYTVTVSDEPPVSLPSVSTSSGLTSALNTIKSNSTDTAFSLSFSGNISLASGAFNLTDAAYAGKTIAITGSVGTEILTVSSNGSLVTVGSGVILIVEDITLKGKTSNTAPLVKVNANGELILKTGAAIIDNINTASDAKGGGVFVANGGIFIMDGGTISGNSASDSDDGYYTGSGGTTYASAYGGGVYAEIGGTFILNDGEIKNNQAYAYAYKNTSSYSGSASASGGGGGVYIASGGFFTKTGGIIYGKSEASGLKNRTSISQGTSTSSSSYTDTNGVAISGPGTIGVQNETIGAAKQYSAGSGWTP